jgi:hypothetical protein
MEAIKADLTTAHYTEIPSKLVAIYVDAENKFWYAVSEEANGKHIIRKMSITRDITYARSQFVIAKRNIGKKVVFGVTEGWNSSVWFNEVKVVE